MYLLQALIAGSVLSANVYFGWTDNGYIAAAWAFMAAYGVTMIISKISDLSGRKRGLRPPLPPRRQ